MCYYTFQVRVRSFLGVRAVYPAPVGARCRFFISLDAKLNYGLASHRPGDAFTLARGRIALSYLESTLIKISQNAALTTFRINTCKSVSKQTTLTSFRINPYKKHRGVGLLWLTRHPRKGVCPEEHRDEGPLLRILCPEPAAAEEWRLSHAPNPKTKRPPDESGGLSD